MTRTQQAGDRSSRHSERLDGILFPEADRRRTPEDLGQRLANEELHASGLGPAVLGLSAGRRSQQRRRAR